MKKYLNFILENINNIISLKFYYISFELKDESIVYKQPSIKNLKNEFDNLDESDFPIDNISKYEKPQFILWERKNTYKFIKVLEDDETIDDYPIDDYYDNNKVYNLIEENEWKSIDDKLFESEDDKYNKKVYEFAIEFELFKKLFQKKYSGFIHHDELAGFGGKSHYFILLINEDGELISNKNGKLIDFKSDFNTYDHLNDNTWEIEKRERIIRNIDLKDKSLIKIQIRFSDHRQNIENINSDIATSLSITNATNYSERKFNKKTHSSEYHEEILIEDSDDVDFNFIMHQIDNYINESREHISKNYKKLVNI